MSSTKNNSLFAYDYNGKFWQFKIINNIWTNSRKMPLETVYHCGNFNDFAILWDWPSEEWIILHDFETGNLFLHGEPGNLSFYNWNNYYYPPKVF